MNSLLALEIAWTTGAIIGFLLSIYNLNDVVTDKRVLKRSKLNGLRLLSVNGNIRSEALRLFIHFMFVVIGITALLLPNTEETRSAASWIITLLLIAGNMTLAANTVYDKLHRRKLFMYVETVEEKLARQEKDLALSVRQETTEALERIESEQTSVRDELHSAQERADAASEDPDVEAGDAADEASRSPKR